MSLTPQQIAVVKATVPVLEQRGQQITTTFYRNLLGENSELKNVFSLANMASGRQPAALAHGLLAYARNIEDPAVLGDFVERVCQKHASLSVEPAQYAVVGKYLLAAMGEVLGSAFTDEVEDAWGAAYWILANIMIDREATLYRGDPSWTGFRDFRVASKRPESSEITSFYLEPVDKQHTLATFLPGQYISIRLRVPGTELFQPRQYSLSDAPNGNLYRISVRKEPRVPGLPEPAFISNLLHERVDEGDVLQVSHPRGEFFYDAKDEAQRGASVVLLSAGVGITPMMSILKSIVAEAGQEQRRIHMIHGARTTQALAFDREVRRICKERADVRRTLFIKNPGSSAIKGEDYDLASRVQLDALDAQKDLFTDDAAALYFVCGPVSFMDDVQSHLERLGVEARRIKQEKFGA
ncbi:hypothetical protein ACQY0O_004133 [Thecaphora frezii]